MITVSISLVRHKLSKLVLMNLGFLIQKVRGRLSEEVIVIMLMSICNRLCDTQKNMQI